MSGTDGLTAFYEITSVAFGVGACLVAWASYRYSRARGSRTASDEQVRRLAREVTAAATDSLAVRLAALEVSVATRVAVLESVTGGVREQAQKMQADMEAQRDKAAGQRDRLMEAQTSQAPVLQLVNDSLRQITQSLARLEGGGHRG